MNMSLDRSGLSADGKNEFIIKTLRWCAAFTGIFTKYSPFLEYYATALQIFDYCGAESTGYLRVDTLMDKFAPFVKTNK